MAWTAVATVVTGDIITASWGNVYVRDNTDYLKDTIDNHIADAADAHAASAITNTPAGAVVATTVQAALNELDGDKVAIPGSSAQGDILIRGAAAYERLAPGTDGYFLKTQGAGANPIWVANSAANAEIYLTMFHLSPSPFTAAYSASYAAVGGSQITFTSGNWSSGVTFYFESFFYVNGFYTCTAQLWNDTDSASISEITTTSYGVGALVRSTALTMPAGTKTLKVRYKLSTSGNGNAYFARIIAVMA